MKYIETRDACPVCRSKNVFEIHKLSFEDKHFREFILNLWDDFDFSILSGANYEIEKCNVCGFCYQKYVLDDRFVYSDTVPVEKNVQKNKVVARSEISYFYTKAREVERASFFLKKPPHEISVLDFGAGIGYWSRMAKAYGYNVHAVDISAARRELFAADIPIVSQISELGDIKFDYVHCDQVLEHMQQPKEGLSKIIEAMNSGAIIYISVPDCRNLEKKLEKTVPGIFLKEVGPLSHINCFDNKTLKYLVQSLGLRLLPISVMLSGGLKSLPRSQTPFVAQELLKYIKNQFLSTNLFFIKE